MKRFITLILGSVLGLNALLGQVIETSDTVTSTAELERWSLNLPFLNMKMSGLKPHRPSAAIGSTLGCHGLYAGVVIPYDSPAAISTGWEIGLQQVLGADIPFRQGGTSLRLGAGFGWRIVNVNGGMTLAATPRGKLLLEPLPDDATRGHARITTFHFTVPLLLVQPLGAHGVVLSAGAELHLNTYTTASSRINFGDNNVVSRKFKGLEQRMATVDAVAYLGWRGKCGVYARWSPAKPWRTGFGPDYTTASIGLMLGF